MLTDLSQGRIPGTDRWKPIDENPDAEEDTSGVLIVRIRENLDFGTRLSRNPFPSRANVSSTNPATAANTAQLKGAFLTIIIACLLTDVIIMTR